MGHYPSKIAAVPVLIPTSCSALFGCVFLRCHYGVCLNRIPFPESWFMWYLYGRDICLFLLWACAQFRVLGPFSAKKTLCSSQADKFWWLLLFCFLMWGDILILPSYPSNLFFISGTQASICLGSDFLWVSFSEGELLPATAFNHILMAKGLQRDYVIKKMALHILPRVLPQLDSACFPHPLLSNHGEEGKNALRAVCFSSSELTTHPKCKAGSNSWNLWVSSQEGTCIYIHNHQRHLISCSESAFHSK